MIDLEKLKRDIEEQTRNGRNHIYIKETELKELEEYKIKETDIKRVYADISYIQELISIAEKNKFKDSLKLHTKLEKIDKQGYNFKHIEDKER